MLIHGAPFIEWRKYKWAYEIYKVSIMLEIFRQQLKVLAELTRLCSKLVVVQANEMLTKGMTKKVICKSTSPSTYANQNPREFSQELFGLESPCPPAIMLLSITV